VQRELEEKLAKEKLAKSKNNWDERLMRSEKLKDLYEDLTKKEQGTEKREIPRKIKEKIT
jgi:hypothetical protein